MVGQACGDLPADRSQAAARLGKVAAAGTRPAVVFPIIEDIRSAAAQTQPLEQLTRLQHQAEGFGAIRFRVVGMGEDAGHQEGGLRPLGFLRLPWMRFDGAKFFRAPRRTRAGFLFVFF
jgi:hypothetical protein